MPVDEVSKDPSFLEFRTRLIEAVKNHDADFVLSVVPDNIEVSFGGSPLDITDGSDMTGKEYFKTMWGLEKRWFMNLLNYRYREENWSLWDLLDRVIAMGGSFRGEGNTYFEAPYVSSAWPSDDDGDATKCNDAYDCCAVIRNKAAVYDIPHSPAKKGKIISELSYDIVKRKDELYDGVKWMCEGWLPRYAGSISRWWTNIVSPEGMSGWIKNDDMYCPVGWRATFEKRDGRWWMIVFIAGD